MLRRPVLLAVLTLVGCLISAAAASGQPNLQLPIVPATIAPTPYSQPLAPGFLGFSFEYRAMHQYTGRDPTAINPTLLNLIRLLNPAGSPMIRIGGNSTDDTWWPMPGQIPPNGINYALSRGWLRTTQAFASDLGAKLTMGINLESGRPALAAAEARAILSGISPRSLAALEIGNEPDLYPLFVWYANRRHQVFFGRPSTYTAEDFISEFTSWRRLLPPSVPLAGPTLSSSTWMPSLPTFISQEPGLRYVTFHRYPLRGCEHDPTQPDYASISNLLADRSAAGLAQQVAPYVTTAHGAGLQFRLDELNSAACTGRTGVSDTFAAALWMLDTLFGMASAGVDGVNVHTLPKAAYAPFAFSQSSSGIWSADVRPAYYGMLMFAQADPPGARLLDVGIASGPVKVWATQAPDGHTRVVLINKDPSNLYTVRLSLPPGSAPATLERLTAPTITATTGVTIGGQSFPAGTTTAKLAGPQQLSTITPTLGAYDVTLPAGSAALLTR